MVEMGAMELLYYFLHKIDIIKTKHKHNITKPNKDNDTLKTD